MSIETFEYRGAVITLDYDHDALCPIEGAGSWAEGVGIVRNERGSIESDPKGLLKAVRDYEEDCERAELWELEAPEKPNVYVFEHTAYELYGHPTFTVAVDRDVVAKVMQIEVATDADCEKYGAGVAMEYAMWAEGVVYSIAVALPDGEVEVTGGVYFESGYPDEGEVIEFVESTLTWDNPADNESEDDATGGAVVSVKVSDAVKNLGGAGFSAGEVGFILGVLGAGV